MPITVKEFYERWEDVESKLIDMIASPMLSTSTLAKENLKELYQLKKELDKLKPKPTIQIKGINTKIFGRVSFESIEKYANDYHDISSEKHMLIEDGAVFSDKYTEENLRWFMEKGYLPKYKNIK